MEDLETVEDETRYRFLDLHGVPETRSLDFHSPSGCSKGAGDQYVRDYARIFGLNSVVMRQSCIYGRRQMGVEDQGWVAHFCISACLGRPITIYGDGKQVRDLLWIDDLIGAYHAAAERRDVASGKIYNIGGGPSNTLSIWAEFGPLLSELAGRPIERNTQIGARGTSRCMSPRSRGRSRSSLGLRRSHRKRASAGCGSGWERTSSSSVSEGCVERFLTDRPSAWARTSI